MTIERDKPRLLPRDWKTWAAIVAFIGFWYGMIILACLLAESV